METSCLIPVFGRFFSASKTIKTKIARLCDSSMNGRVTDQKTVARRRAEESSCLCLYRLLQKLGVSLRATNSSEIMNLVSNRNRVDLSLNLDQVFFQKSKKIHKTI